jgi:hypothetical protein
MKEAYASRHEVNRTYMAQQVLGIYEKNDEKMDFTWGDVEQESYGALFAGSDTTNCHRTPIAVLPFDAQPQRLCLS